MSQPLTDAINALTAYSNTITGASDTTLSDAVESLVDGYGGGGYSIDDIALRSISGDIVITSNSIGDFAFAKCTGLTSVYANGPTGTLGASAFAECTGLTKIFLATNTNFPSSNVRVFNNVTAVIVWLSLTSVESRRFEGWKGTKLDLTDCSTIAGTGFYNVSNMNTLILRKSDSPVILKDTNAFNGSPFASSGSGGTLYVPNGLISSYQSADKWSTILGYANNSIQKIEGSIYENAYADGTPISS